MTAPNLFQLSLECYSGTWKKKRLLMWGCFHKKLREELGRDTQGSQSQETITEYIYIYSHIGQFVFTCVCKELSPRFMRHPWDLGGVYGLSIPQNSHLLLFNLFYHYLASLHAFEFWNHINNLWTHHISPKKHTP